MSLIHYIPLSEIRRIRSLSCSVEKKTSLFANVCRINTLYMIAKAGSGHIGSSFSSMDIISWLFLNELALPDTSAKTFSDDIYFSSKGHDVPGLYSVLIGLERIPFDMIHKLRQIDGLPGHPDVETPYMVTNTGPLGMGISKAKGMTFAQEILGRKGRVFVLTGDGELQEGQFWESLGSAANLKISNITVIIDHNKIQSDTWVADVSDLGDLDKKLNAFGWDVDRCDGHDLNKLSEMFSNFSKNKTQPHILIADTIKGKGVSIMENFSKGDPLYKFHSGAPSEEVYKLAFDDLTQLLNDELKNLGEAALETISGERPEKIKSETAHLLVGAYSKALVSVAEKNSKIVALDADLVLDTGLIPFREKFPDRFRECGIAEQDMVSQAGGMALTGVLPIVHSFACFLSTRPNEQIYNNSSEKSKIIYVGSLAGLIPAGPGHSHQSVRDISALAAMPGLILFEPCHEKEVGLALDYFVNETDESSYLRLVSVPCEIPYSLPENYQLTLGQGAVLQEGKDALVIGYGPILLPEIWKAAQLLEKKGMNITIVNLPWLNRIDDKWLKGIAADYDWVFTLDNHYIKGGQGEFIASRLPQLGLSKVPNVAHFGLTDIPACGTNADVLKFHGLDAESLMKSISEKISLVNI